MNKTLEELSDTYNLPLASALMSYPFIQEKKEIISYSIAKNYMILPLDLVEDQYLVAVSDPLKIQAIEEITLILQKSVKIVLASPNEIQSAIEFCYHRKKKDSFEKTQSRLEASKEKQFDLDSYDLLEKSSDSPVIEILNMIFLEAIQVNASDIHFEPKENGIEIRFRIDGILQREISPPYNLQNQVLTRIKVLSQLDIAEKRLPQDGRLKLRVGKREIDFRVSTLPTMYGERIVLRILDRGNVQLGLPNIGVQNQTLKYVQHWMQMTEGIILVTGPTGSGKTTTLYSILSELNAEEKNIVTIEDPVEYKLAGISQIAVNPKIQLDFARGLRHILRQDPDIIMVGEIRDSETAEISIQASLTGHLVLSTIHTNDAPSTITRLVDMGIEPYLISSSLTGVISQRLVRTICSNCGEGYSADEVVEKKYKIKTLYKGRGCDSCFHMGYKGRVGIFEYMNVDSFLQSLISKKAHTHEIREYLASRKVSTLLSSGLELVKEGKTTLEEIIRVTRSNEEILL